MNPFENINIPGSENSAPIECGSDLTDNIGEFFQQKGRYLDQETAEGILNRLGDDINSCHTKTRESFAELNNDMFENGINLIHGGVGEEEFLVQIGINKADLIANFENFPEEYTFRESGKWIIFSDMEGKPLINYDKDSGEYTEASWNTFTDNMNDNVDGGSYALAEALLGKRQTDEAIDEIDQILQEGSIQIDELETFEGQETISRLYGLQLGDFQKALSYFIEKSNISLFHRNPDMQLLSSGNFQISAILENGEHHIVNYFPNGDVESEYTF